MTFDTRKSRILFLFLTLFLCIAMVPHMARAATCFEPIRILSVTMSGSDVSQLQELLRDTVGYSGPITGYFGPLTKAAVGAWQIQNSIVVDGSTPGYGNVGPKTRAAMSCAAGNSASSRGLNGAVLSGDALRAEISRLTQAILELQKKYSILASAPSQTSPSGSGSTVDERGRDSSLSDSQTSSTCTFTASPVSVEAGQSSTLRWEISQANSVTIDQGIGVVAASGSRIITPSASGSYTLTAAGSSGSRTCAVTISVVARNVEANPTAVTHARDSGPGSFRQAILNASASPASPSRIVFMLPENERRICPASPLPDITQPVHIDGTSQRGYASKPLITLDGSCMGTMVASGLTLMSDNTIVQGLVIQNFTDNGIVIRGKSGNKIVGNYIGTSADGMLQAGNKGNGIFITGNSTRNEIGGVQPAEQNVISGNGVGGEAKHGILITGGSNTTIVNNLIGTNALGTGAIGNGTNGISIYQSGRNTIGGPGPQYRNVISGNGTVVPGGVNQGYGITVAGPESGEHVIQGNYVGTDITGMKKIPNIRTGINLHNSPQNLIGGSNPLARNVFSGNGRHGINIDGNSPLDCQAEPHFGNKGYSHHNQIIGNYIGTNAAGTAALGNGTFGIVLFKTQSATVENNIVAGNGYSPTEPGEHDGIWIYSDPDGCTNYGSTGYAPEAPDRLNYIARGNIINANRIGIGKGGEQIPNAANGIRIFDSLNNFVGKDGEPATANIIKFNKGFGVKVEGVNAPSNKVSPVNIIQNNEGGSISTGGTQ